MQAEKQVTCIERLFYELLANYRKKRDMKLLLQLVCKDFQRNRIITAALAVFLIISALFMAGGLRVTGTMMSSMKGLSTQAVSPDYLQMHRGAYDEKAFYDFAESQDYIRDSIIVKMLTIRNASIVYQAKHWKGSTKRTSMRKK